MSLRSRYSLLILLLLTAAVAGGMKLWRGPHWAELHEPMTQEEQAVLERYYHLRDFINTAVAEKVQYRYTRDFEHATWDLIEGRVFIRPLLLTASPRQIVSGYPWALPLKNGWQSIVYWVANVDSENCPRQTQDPSQRPQPFGIYGMEETCCIYLLTDELRIYRMTFASENDVPIEAIELSQVANTPVRELLTAEIAALQETAQASKLKP